MRLSRARAFLHPLKWDKGAAMASIIKFSMLVIPHASSYSFKWESSGST